MYEWLSTHTGKSPYPNVAVDTNFYKMIKDGCHMTQPDFAPVEMSATSFDRSHFGLVLKLKGVLSSQVSADDTLLEFGAHGQTNL